MTTIRLWIGLVVAIASFAGCAIIETPIKNSAVRNKTTTELQLRHAQIGQRLGDKRTEFTVTPFGGGTKGHEDEWEEKERIERELLRRYTAGEKAAFLPIFKAATAGEPK